MNLYCVEDLKEPLMLRHPSRVDHICGPMITSQYGPINGLLERDEEHDCERYGEYTGAMSHMAYGGGSLTAYYIILPATISHGTLQRKRGSFHVMDRLTLPVTKVLPIIQ